MDCDEFRTAGDLDLFQSQNLREENGGLFPHLEPVGIRVWTLGSAGCDRD